MMNAFFQNGKLISFASNRPLDLSTQSGVFLLESGTVNLFLTEAGGSTYGRRRFIAELTAGDVFLSGESLAISDESRKQYVCLIVPAADAVCRVCSRELFEKLGEEFSGETTEICKKWLNKLCSQWTLDELRERPEVADVHDISAVTNAILLRVLTRTTEYENELVQNRTAEEENGENELDGQYSRLRRIVKTETSSTRQDTALLSGALNAIAAEYSLTVLFPLTELEAVSPEEQLQHFCEINRWRTRRIRLEPGFRKLTHGTLIGFYGEDCRPCLLHPAKGESTWNFPDEKLEHPLNAAAFARLKPFAYCFYENLPNRKLHWHDLTGFLFSDSHQLLGRILIVGLLVGLLGLVTPLATQYVAGKIIPTANYTELWQLTVLLLSLSLGSALLNLVPQLSVLIFGSRLLERFLAALYERTFRLPIRFFRKFNSGDLCVRIFSSIQLQESLFQVISQQFLGAVFSLCSLAMLFWYSWKLALVAVPMVLLYCGLLTILFLKLQPSLRKVSDAAGRESAFLKQMFDGIAKIRGDGAETRIINRFLNDFTEENEAHYRCLTGNGRMAVLSVMFPALTYLLFFYLIGDVWRGGMGLPGFLAFLSAYGTFSAGMTAIANGLWTLASQKALWERLQPFLDAVPETADGKPLAGCLDGSLELSHVTFRYSPDTPPVLKDISLRVSPGEFVAVVGPSGAGKSSLLRILLGFEQPGNGSVLYSGRDLAAVDIDSVRRQLGVILQNSTVMPGSILDNITTGTDCTLEEAQEAAKLAALDRDLDEMPMGIFTEVSDGLVSGGQQQRILIARALVGKPAIIMMDEATSALDNETQETVRRNIEKLQTTRIVIAHRLSTIVNADRIYVLENGEIKESGTLEQLMKNNGPFRKLAERQIL